MRILQGISASSGIGIGSVFLIPEMEKNTVIRKTIIKDDVESQWQKLLMAVEQVKDDISSLIDPANNEQSTIFESYSMMLNDTVFLEQIKKAHESSLINIEYVLFTHYQELADSLRKTDDDYLKQRADDICDIYGRVVDVLLGRKPFDMNSVREGSIVAAKSLKPTDAVILAKKKLKAFILEEGGVNSHFGILARNYGIPAVFGITDIYAAIEEDADVIVDGDVGTVYVNPDRKTLDSYTKASKDEEKRILQLSSFKTKNAWTKDGARITLLANIGTPEEAVLAKEEGADGIGLFRTEFLFMNEEHFLSEEEQFDVYRSVLTTMGDLPVTIRTLDIGADKAMPLDTPVEEELNPLLGWRAIRFCLDNKEIFKTQLKALLRASIYGNLRIMFPLISGYDELLEVLAIVEECKKELKKKKKPFNENIPFGTMIETASAAVMSDMLASKVNFFSIGTNDLTQYTLGVDRDNARVAHLYNEFHPAILRLISQTVQNANKAGITACVCGEMASRPDGIAVLTGLGVRQLSMGVKQLCGAKELISRFTLAELTKLSADVLAMPSTEEIKKFLAQEIQR